MTKEEKAKTMNEVTCELNRAKYAMDEAVQHLEEKGMLKDAEQLYKMILKLEMFQTKYDTYRL